MSKEKFTKGPWSFYYSDGRIENEVGKIICAVGDDWGNYENADENAALISAAPEMYEMLKRFADNNIVFPLSMRNDMHALLAKARGEQ